MSSLLFDGAPVTVALAQSAGVSRQALSTLVRDGAMRRVLRGVYVDATAPDTPDLRARAAQLVVPPGSVLAGVGAAWLLGVPPLLPGAHERPPPLELLRASGLAPVRRHDVRGRVAVLSAQDVVECHGVLVTTPARTTVDLARTLDRPFGLSYVDAMLGRRLVSHADLQVQLDRIAGFPWVEQARELVALGDGRAESPGESWLRLRWSDAGLPKLELQIPFLVDGVECARLDAGVTELKFGVEYDGEAAHPPERRDHDDGRRRWLFRQFGWTVLAVGRGEVLGRDFGFEAAVAELSGLQPRLVPWELRRRTYLHRRRRTA